MLRRLAMAATGVLVLLGVGFVVWQNVRPRPENQGAGRFPEALVYVRSSDDVVSAGAIFGPPKESSRPVAIIWIHGWGANFYSPTYVGIGRALADRGYTSLVGNTRMHDIGNVAKYSWGKRVRGGGYWGVTSEEGRDLAAWIDFAESQGFRHVILIGHSAGWATVARYQAETRDERVAGVVLASGGIRFTRGPDDPELVAQATRLVADGAGEDLLRLPNRSAPSFVSAATFLDIVNTPLEYGDFFGTKVTNPAVMRIRCPLLAFHGTKEPDTGTESDLTLLKASAERHASGPSRVDIAMIQNADHEYVGQESQVAGLVAQWADSLVPANAARVALAAKE